MLLDFKEKWCYFLSKAGQLTTEDRKALSKNKKMKEALKHFDELSEDRKVQDALDEFRNDLIYNLDKQGWIDEGKIEGKEQVALNLLELDVKLSKIAKATGFSENKILELKKKR